MITHISVDTNRLKKLLHHGLITHGGNQRLRIYGDLHCASGKRMKTENRVFFQSEEEAQLLGYRPCSHCMNKQYKKWKNNHELL